MAIKIALAISIILQFTTAIIALTLIKRTRWNIAWWLISIGFLLMAIRLLFEFLQFMNSQSRLITGLLSSWLGVLISILMLISLVFVRQIFNVQKRIDELRKQSESRVLSAIIKTEEKERQHFANELHDGLGPLLSSVKMTISATRKNLNDSNTPQLLENAENIIDQTIITLKEISNKLSPHVLNNFGLHKAIKSFISNLHALENISIHYSSNLENMRFPYNIEVVLYRVVCELINNTLKHASAKNIYIELNYINNNLSLSYIDDGIGFDKKLIELNNKGMGLTNIFSRIKSINGNIEYYTRKGEGFHLKININV